MHCDPAVIDSLFAHSPNAQVIWDHAGTYPYPQLLRDYLDRYPRLYVDLSVRDERIAPNGELDPDWENLLWEYPDRFLIGVDTSRRALGGLRQRCGTDPWLAGPVTGKRIRADRLPERTRIV